ncbi:MAG TPA: biotin--[acetyl-CoA-carboxylase] ligase [Candidatus Dormibacteraeota bacterium]|nr:biotin--[acetyl-CoA-carboxylase] ligase [Candidatus Dormibacteraeota bacterium]
MTVERIVRLGAVTSTQDVARDLPIGSVVVADFQTAGRGRLDRAWESPPGTALLASFVTRLHPVAPLAAGVAAAEACAHNVGLKWPNDLVLKGRKVGGILLEASGQKVVVGFGINLSWAPPGAARLPMDAVLLLDRLRDRMKLAFSAPPEAVLSRWRALSVTLGKQVRVVLPGETFEGLADDVDEAGHLIVGGRTIAAGDIIHLR